MHPSFCGTASNQRTDKIHTQEHKDRKIINTDMIEQEIEWEKQLDRMDDMSREINLYQDPMVSNEEKIGPLRTKMEQWSILHNVLNYMQHSRFSSMDHTLDVKAVNKCKSKHNTEREFIEFRFWYDTTKITRGIYGHI